MDVVVSKETRLEMGGKEFKRKAHGFGRKQDFLE